MDREAVGPFIKRRTFYGDRHGSLSRTPGPGACASYTTNTTNTTSTADDPTDPGVVSTSTSALAGFGHVSWWHTDAGDHRPLIEPSCVGNSLSEAGCRASFSAPGEYATIDPDRSAF